MVEMIIGKCMKNATICSTRFRFNNMLTTIIIKELIQDNFERIESFLVNQFRLLMFYVDEKFNLLTKKKLCLLKFIIHYVCIECVRLE